MAITNFPVTLTAKLRHGTLYAAAMKVGSQAALAKILGVANTELGLWVNLKKMPSFERGKFSDPEFVKQFEEKLFKATGLLIDQIFPPELRGAKEFWKMPKAIELTKAIPIARLGSATPERMLLPDPSVVAEENERRSVIDKVLKTLTERERIVLKLRFGLNGGDAMTLTEASKVLGITQARVRQIEHKAIRKIQNNDTRLDPLKSLL